MHSTLHTGPRHSTQRWLYVLRGKYHETYLRLPAVLYILFNLLEKLPTSAKCRTIEIDTIE
jgi:hypothetical protein